MTLLVGTSLEMTRRLSLGANLPIYNTSMLGMALTWTYGFGFQTIAGGV